jgi:type III pantothenate kinase
MNLALDFGNTRIKAAVFDNGKIVREGIFRTPAELLGSEIFGGIVNCIICSVTSLHIPVLEQKSKLLNLVLFRPDTPLPVTNTYKSALTLGSDRLACAVGGYSLYPDQNVLTIDGGTCIKYNFVNNKNEYLGGAISPGLWMRLRAMNHYTQRLPLVEPEWDYGKLVGNTTSESLLTGALVGAACEVDEMINRYKAEFGEMRVVLTGGDGPYLSGQLKNSFFAHQNLLLQGLNTILEYNLEK